MQVGMVDTNGKDIWLGDLDAREVFPLSTEFLGGCWHVIKHDFMAAVQQFENQACNRLHILNESTLILVAKKLDASQPKDYMPISLIRSFVKILRRVFARRLQPRMAELVKPCQSAFIKGCMIHDNFSYISKVWQKNSNRKVACFALKS